MPSELRSALLYGQIIAEHNLSFAEVPDKQRKSTSTAWLIAGGVAGGVVGAAVVGYADYLRLRGANPSSEVTVPVFGSLIGYSLGMPLGVHLTNGKRGRFLVVAGGSFAIGALGALASLGLLAASPTVGLILGAATPLAQIAMSIYLERYTSRDGTVF